MARLATFTPNLQTDLCRVMPEISNNKPSLDDIITLSGLAKPDHSGWLIDQSCGEQRFCVLADMLFCIFQSEQCQTPLQVLVLPGHKIRSIMFNSAKCDSIVRDGADDNERSSRTITGLLRHNFLISSPCSDETLTLAAECQSVRDTWVAYLKMAANLDRDLFDSGSEPEEDSNTGPASLSRPPQEGKESGRTQRESILDVSPLVLNGVNMDIPRYMPTNSGAETRQRRLSQGISLVPSDEPVFSKVIRSNSLSCLSKQDINGNTLDEKYVREDDKENAVKEPMKPRARFKSDGSIKVCSHKSSDNSTSDPVKSSPRRKDSIGSSRKGSFPRSPSLSRRLIHKASSFKEKMMGIKPASHLDDQAYGLLTDILHSGCLMYKHALKWWELHCVVSVGHFLGYKSTNETDLPEVSLPLSQCSVLEAPGNKTHPHIFKLCHLNARNIYLSANTQDDYMKWMTVLKSHTRAPDSSQSVTNGDTNVVRRNSQHTQSPMKPKVMVKASQETKSVDDSHVIRKKSHSLRDALRIRRHSLALGSEFSKSGITSQKSSKPPGPTRRESISRPTLDKSKELNPIDQRLALSARLHAFSSEKSKSATGKVPKFRSPKLRKKLQSLQLNVSNNLVNKNMSFLHLRDPVSVSDSPEESPCDLRKSAESELLSGALRQETSSPVESPVDTTRKQVRIVDSNVQQDSSPAYLPHISLTASESSSVATSEDTESAFGSSIDDDVIMMSSLPEECLRERLKAAHENDPFTPQRCKAEVPTGPLVYNRHLPGPNNEGLLLVDDDSSERPEQGEVFRKRSLSDGNLALRLSATSERGFSNCQSIEVVRGDNRVPVAARELTHPTYAGFLDCWEQGDWKSYWSVLHESSLYRYTSPDDKETTYLVALRGYEVITCHAFQGRDLVFELVHPDSSTETFSCESMEDYEQWLDCLRAAVQDMTIEGLNLEEGRSQEFDDVDAESVSSDGLTGQWQQQLIQLRKQQLLQELLQQKAELQVSLEKNKHLVKHDSLGDGDDDSLSRLSTSGELRSHSSLSWSHTQARPRSLCLGPDKSKLSSAKKGVSHEQTMRDITHLKQRKISTQLKVDSLEKRLDTFQTRKQKRKFKLGLGKTSESVGSEVRSEPSNREHLERELSGLREQLVTIDQCLEQRRHKTLLDEVIAAPVVVPSRRKGVTSLGSNAGKRDKISTSSELSNRSKDIKKSLSSVGSTPTSEIGDSFDLSVSSANSDFDRLGGTYTPPIDIKNAVTFPRPRYDSSSHQSNKSESLDSLEDLLGKMSQRTPSDGGLRRSWDNLLQGNSALRSHSNSSECSPKLTPETVKKSPLMKRSTFSMGESENSSRVASVPSSCSTEGQNSISQDSLAKIAAFEELLQGTLKI